MSHEEHRLLFFRLSECTRPNVVHFTQSNLVDEINRGYGYRVGQNLV